MQNFSVPLLLADLPGESVSLYRLVVVRLRLSKNHLTGIPCGRTWYRSFSLPLFREMLALFSEFMKKLVFELSSDTSFGAFVSPAIRRLGERLAAMLASEWLDVQVNTHVVKSARQACERLLTLFAGQGLILLACVGISNKATS